MMIKIMSAPRFMTGTPGYEWDAQTLRGAKSASVVGIMGPITEALIIPWGISLSPENIWRLKVEKNRYFAEKTTILNLMPMSPRMCFHDLEEVLILCRFPMVLVNAEPSNRLLQRWLI